MTVIRELGSGDQAALAGEVAEALRRGQLVLLPTETVYGLCGRGDDPAVLARLRAAKGRDERPFAFLAPGLQAVRDAGAALPPPALRLARRYWPGPLTLVLDQAGESAPRGWRVPGHAFVREVLLRAGVPVVATSANRSGQPDATSCQDALQALGGAVDLAVDGGRSALGAPSTVVRVGGLQPLEVLREGFLSSEEVERTALRRIVFVCTGNTCRSPMAMGLARRALARSLEVEDGQLPALGWVVESAGVAAAHGAPAALNAVAALARREIDIARHRSRPAEPALLERASWIIALSPSHLPPLEDRLPPDQLDRLRLLDPDGVPDPIGGSLSLYEETAAHIERRLPALVEEWMAEDRPPEPVPRSVGAAASPPPARAASRDLAGLFPAPGAIPAEHDLRRWDGGEQYLVAGQVRRWAGPSLPVESIYCERGPDGQPTRREIGRSAALSGEVALEALEAATRAWDHGHGQWPRMAPAQRIACVRAWCQAVLPRREEIARLLMWEIGKAWPDALKEFDRTIEAVDATIHAYQQELAGGGLLVEGGVVAAVRRAPLGVVLCMGPFNYPLNETLATVIPALLAGNVVVIKLPKLGILCNLPLLEGFAGCFPPGVVNVLHGDGATLVSPLMQSGKIDVLAFIGSAKVSGIVEKQHPAPWRLATILGLEAKNPALVLPDADLDVALPQLLQGALSYNGQRCTALKIIHVHRSRADELVERLAAGIEALPCGMPWEPGVKITPLPEPDKARWLSELIDDAVAHGARVVNPSGGAHAGTFFFPALVWQVPPQARLQQVEQFGPLVPVVAFDEVDDVLRQLAESPFGQQASLFGRDPARLGPVVDALANLVCRININRQCQRGPDSLPFTGRKSSAEGVLSTLDALRAFSVPNVIAAGDDAAGRELFQALRGRSTFLGG